MLAGPEESALAFPLPPQTALRLRDIARMHLMFGGDLMRALRSDEAEPYLRAALAIDPQLTPALGLLGRALLDGHRLDEALHVLRAAVRQEPGNPFHRGTLGSALLLGGRYRDGWAEWATTRALSPQLGPSEREWNGRDALAGRTLLVICCDGFGDAFQFARFLPRLAERGARLVVACQAVAMPVLRRVPGVAGVVDRDGPRPAHDLWTEDKILPLRLGIEVATIPLAEGYLTADPARVEHWRRRLPAGRRVGLVWGGDPKNDQDAARSLPPGQVAALLAPVLAVPGLAMVSVQHGERRAEVGTLRGVVDIAPDLTDFGETAAALACMDVVIGVETAVTHLAGAMGVPTWVMLSRRPDWRWMLTGDTSPWYASARLWRQPALGDWASVTAAVGAALARVQEQARQLAL
jgi:hypothetical protein